VDKRISIRRAVPSRIGDVTNSVFVRIGTFVIIPIIPPLRISSIPRAACDDIKRLVGVFNNVVVINGVVPLDDVESIIAIFLYVIIGNNVIRCMNHDACVV